MKWNEDELQKLGQIQTQQTEPLYYQFIKQVCTITTKIKELGKNVQ